MSPSNTAVWLGAAPGSPRNFSVFVFVPSQTRDGEPLDHERLRDATINEMAHLFQGATALEGRGGWRDDDRGGEVGVEQISAVFSLMAAEDWNEENVSRLATFLHQMGRSTNQGEIGLVVNGEYFPIRTFDK